MSAVTLFEERGSGGGTVGVISFGSPSREYLIIKKIIIITTRVNIIMLQWKGEGFYSRGILSLRNKVGKAVHDSHDSLPGAL